MRERVPIDNLLKEVQNKFLLSNSLAQRAKQISEGSLPYIDRFFPDMPLETAMHEISEGKFEVQVLAAPMKPKEKVNPRLKEKLTFAGLEKKDKKKYKKKKS